MQTPGIHGHLMGAFHLLPQKHEFQEIKFGLHSANHIRLSETLNFRAKYSFDFQGGQENKAAPSGHSGLCPTLLRSTRVACCYGSWLLISERRWLGRRQMSINRMPSRRHRARTPAPHVRGGLLLWTTTLMWTSLSRCKPAKHTSKN